MAPNGKWALSPFSHPTEFIDGFAKVEGEIACNSRNGECSADAGRNVGCAAQRGMVDSPGEPLYNNPLFD
jgi:hypothetical protein